MVGDEPLDVELDIGSIVEQAFHIYDTVLGDGGREHIAPEEIGLAQQNVPPIEEIKANNGPLENNDSSCNMVGNLCDDRDPADDDDYKDGWWDAPQEWLRDDDLNGMASDGDFEQATPIFSVHELLEDEASTLLFFGACLTTLGATLILLNLCHSPYTWHFKPFHLKLVHYFILQYTTSHQQLANERVSSIEETQTIGVKL